MARHSQPREVAALKGADKKNPQRYRTEAPKSVLPLGSAPDHLSEMAKAVWFELEAYAPAGVLAGSDRLMLETAAVLVAEFRENTKDFPASKMGHMIGVLARLGMSPSDRQKLGAEKTKEEDPFSAF